MPFGLHQFVTLSFGAPTTFQRLMDKILPPHSAYAAHVCPVLRSLRVAGLTANPWKCAIGCVDVRYLGFLGTGAGHLQIDKTAAIVACPGPKTKKEVRQFIGLVGYFRRFIPNYSELAR